MIRCISRMLGSKAWVWPTMSVQTGAIRGRDDRVAFVQRQRQRLLDQNMLAVLQRLDRLLA